MWQMPVPHTHTQNPTTLIFKHWPWNLICNSQPLKNGNTENFAGLETCPLSPFNTGQHVTNIIISNVSVNKNNYTTSKFNQTEIYQENTTCNITILSYPELWEKQKQGRGENSVWKCFTICHLQLYSLVHRSTVITSWVITITKWFLCASKLW